MQDMIYMVNINWAAMAIVNNNESRANFILLSDLMPDAVEPQCKFIV